MMKAFIIWIIVFSGLITGSCNERGNKPKILEENPEIQELPWVASPHKNIQTDKNPENNEWKENVYKNRFYKFSIEFPMGWDYDNSGTKSVLARAINLEYATEIIITVTHLSNPPNDPDNIFDGTSMDEFKTGLNKILANSHSIAENIKIEKSTLSDFPAYLIQYTKKDIIEINPTIYLSKQILCYHNSILYLIAMNLPQELFDNDMQAYYSNVVNSFRFEQAP